ncbi:unnamed protein product, partial [Rotaria magnacalcarata]
VRQQKLFPNTSPPTPTSSKWGH